MKKLSLLAILIVLISSCQNDEEIEILAEEDCTSNHEYTRGLCKGVYNRIDIRVTFCNIQAGNYDVLLKRGSQTIQDLGKKYLESGRSFFKRTVYIPPASLVEASDYYYEFKKPNSRIVLLADVSVASCDPGGVFSSPVGGYDDYFERDREDAIWQTGFFEKYAQNLTIRIKDSSGGTLKEYLNVFNDGLHPIRFPTIGGDKHNCYAEISDGVSTYTTGTFTIWDD